MAPAKSRASFEDLYKQLEEKVGLLELGGLSLDDSLSAYEEAVALAQRCQQLLDGAELRITRLRESITATTNGGDGYVALPLDPEDDEAGEVDV